MAALMILNYGVTDRDALNRYRAAAGPLLVGPGLATPVAMSDRTVDLGEGVGEGASAGSDTVVLRFESVEAARAAYDSDEYQAVLGDRLRASTPKFSLIVETID